MYKINFYVFSWYMKIYWIGYSLNILRIKWPTKCILLHTSARHFLSLQILFYVTLDISLKFPAVIKSILMYSVAPLTFLRNALRLYVMQTKIQGWESNRCFIMIVLSPWNFVWSITKFWLCAGYHIGFQIYDGTFLSGIKQDEIIYYIYKNRNNDIFSFYWLGLWWIICLSKSIAHIHIWKYYAIYIICCTTI